MRKKIRSLYNMAVSPRHMVWLVLLAGLLRLALLCVPAFSTDTQRFLSDGINLLEGRNPYTAPPAIAIPYGHLRSFYTPLMEIFFACGTWLWRDPFVFRLLAGASELIFLGWFFLRKRQKKLPVVLTLFLLFNPLSLHEIWREGHLDHIGAFFLYLAIANARAAFAYPRKKWRAVGFTLISIVWKYVGVFAVLFLVRKRGSSHLRQAFSRAISFPAVLAVVFFLSQLIPALFFTTYAERGLTVYATYWHHGNGIVHLLRNMGFADAHGVYIVQRLILIVLLVIGGLYLVRRLSFSDAVCLGIGTMLVLFPVQHPWYYFLLFPLILLYRRWRMPLILLCLLAPLSYLGYTQEFMSVGFWFMLAFWLQATYSMLSSRRARPVF